MIISKESKNMIEALKESRVSMELLQEFIAKGLWDAAYEEANNIITDLKQQANTVGNIRDYVKNDCNNG